jgi:hypothetical protein
MTLFERIEYSGKALVGGAGLGLALCGFVAFFPVTITVPTAATVASVCGLSLSLYTFKNIE